ncbi:MAG: hypothetical protein SF097_02135 [Acidobacteriota bacterium]|nr:hypothetical protein [Acidobacteriota bacterium]
MKNAVTAERERFCPGVRNAPNERRFNDKQLALIAQSLRAHTGWQSLAFDEDGFLVCPNPQTISGGSAAARKLLGEALWGNAAYDLESHPRSQNVKFARLARGANFSSQSKSLRISIYPIQIDLADFRLLTGERTALNAFDPGIAVLHELAHAIWGLPDARSEEDEPGECENYINRIRRELHLPERQSYEAPARPRGLSTRLIAELCFIRFSEKNGKLRQKRFFLRWDAARVGGLADAQLAATMR